MKLTRCGGYFFRRSVDFVDTNVRRGEIYYADLSPVVGSEQGGVRPVLIVQNDTGNRHSPADRQAMTTPRAERYTNFPRKAQQTGRSSPPDRYRANIQQEIRFILSTPLLFFLILPHVPQKAAPSSPRAPISFLADSEEEQHNYQNAGEGAITFSRNVCGLKRTRYKAFHEPLFRCGRRTFCVYSVNFQKNG